MEKCMCVLCIIYIGCCLFKISEVCAWHFYHCPIDFTVWCVRDQAKFAVMDDEA